MTSTFIPADVGDGIVEVHGKKYMYDAKGRMVPIETVGAKDKLIDEQVRKIMGFHIAASEQVARLKEHTFDDISELEALLAQEYDAKLGGAKGNMTLMSFDGCFKVVVQIADTITFGPELTIAKELIDECLNEWAADSRPEIRAIVTRAFNTDKAGQINRSELNMLTRLEITDDRWMRAMQAIKDAMRVVGSKTYVRCHKRDTPDGPWQYVSTDLAKA